MKPFNCYLTDEDDEYLREEAYRRRKSKAEVMRNALDLYREIRKIGVEVHIEGRAEYRTEGEV